ncbi:MAG: FHA domain-containing protein [Bacteriovoracia bacterium]
MPKNDGVPTVRKLDRDRYVKVFELELSNMEDTPVYRLSHQLSIGSEIGNIVITDPSVSPRHASFSLNQEVVSVIDHGSVSGTFVNGKKIPPGKNIILEESDVVMVGDLEVRLRVGLQTIQSEEDPEEEIESEAASVEAEATEEEIAEDSVEVEEIEEDTPPEELPPENVTPAPAPVTARGPRPLIPPKTGSKKKKKVQVPRPTAANSLVRVLAILGDLLVSYAIVIIFMPFDEFRELIYSIPDFMVSLLSLESSALLSNLEKDFSSFVKIGRETYEFLSSLFNFLPLLVVFCLLRFFSTILFGVSLSQYFLGVRALGNRLWLRGGGVLRVLIGFFTAPLLILDLPSILSKRTFKEVITFTHLHTPSKFKVLLGIVIYLPALVGIVLVSPLIQGLEIQESLFIDQSLDKRIKVKQPEAAPAEEATQTTAMIAQSEVLKMLLAYNQDEVTLVPDFKFKGGQNKLKVGSSLLFYQRDLQRPVEMEVFKTFDLRQLLLIGIRGNFFLYEKYPEIYNYAYEAPGSISVKRITVQDQEKFAAEFMRFISRAFSISPENVVEIMQEETPLLKSLIDLKTSFLSLIEYKEFSSIGFIKIGNAVFMRISFIKQKPFDLLIPLVKGQGRIFKVTFDKKENLGAVSSKFYKYNLEKTDWFLEEKDITSQVQSALKVYDLFASDKYQELFSNNDLAQSLYGFYFERSARILQKADPVEVRIWKSKISQLMKLMELLPTKSESDEETIKVKLFQNFRDLFDALENNNLEYFGIPSTTTI